MIDKALQVISSELNRFLQSKHDITEEKVVISSLIELDGSVSMQEPDKIVLSLTNIETDKTQSSVGGYKQTPKGTYKMVKPPVHINLTLLFSAYFTHENYSEGLKFITSVVAFFQSRAGVFNPSNTPNMPIGIDKMQAELLSLEMADLNNFWSSLGSKYLPSVLYRVKTIPIRHETLMPEIPVIKKI